MNIYGSKRKAFYLTPQEAITNMRLLFIFLISPLWQDMKCLLISKTSLPVSAFLFVSQKHCYYDVSTVNWKSVPQTGHSSHRICTLNNFAVSSPYYYSFLYSIMAKRVPANVPLALCQKLSDWYEKMSAESKSWKTTLLFLSVKGHLWDGVSENLR